MHTVLLVSQQPRKLCLEAARPMQARLSATCHFAAIERIQASALGGACLLSLQPDVSSHAVTITHHLSPASSAQKTRRAVRRLEEVAKMQLLRI